MPHSELPITRRTLLRTASASAVASAVAAATGATLAGRGAAAAPSTAGSSTAGLSAAGLSTATSSSAASSAARLFGELDEKIEAGMARYAIPGAAVGVLYRGVEYLKGYGVTNVDDPVPVGPDTVFRVGSTTKTFTGTTVMRLVEAGRLRLDAPVRRYLPDLRTLDPTVAERVTVRQLLNHTAGWLGDYFADTGSDDDALAEYVATLARVPQLTPPGTTFAYNNTGFGVAGRVIEVAAGVPYETAVRRLVIDPLGLAHSRFFLDELAGFDVAISHGIIDGEAVAQPAAFALWRSLNPPGGLISSARDQLRYARFHLGDGTVPGGRTRLLTRQGLRGMRSRPGPGGTLYVELDGVGVSWQLRPSAEGVRVVQHGGDVPGQHSGFLMVPDRGFAITLLTNSDGGPGLVDELFADDWALRRFAGIRNLPAEPRALRAAELARYEGGYVQQAGSDGEVASYWFELTASNGQLLLTVDGTAVARLAFYRPDYAILLGPDGEPAGASRCDFLRGSDGRVRWLRLGGRLARHEAAPPASAGADAAGPGRRQAPGRSSINPLRRDSFLLS